MAFTTFPTLSIGPSGFGMQLIGKTLTLTSPLTKKSQSRDDGGYKWLVEVDYAVLSEVDWRLIQAFFAKVEGQTTRFYYSPPHITTPQGSASGTPTVDGANQTGVSLTTFGWTALSTVLKAGDCFHFDTPTGFREMKMITSDVTADFAGVAILNFEPRIRESPNNGAAIVVNSPSFIGRLASQNMSEINVTPGRLASCNMQIIEGIGE